MSMSSNTGDYYGYQNHSIKYYNNQDKTSDITRRLDLLEQHIHNLEYELNKKEIEVKTLKVEKIILKEEEKEVVIEKKDFDKFIEQHTKNKFKELME